jgi:hypothetical protein
VLLTANGQRPPASGKGRSTTYWKVAVRPSAVVTQPARKRTFNGAIDSGRPVALPNIGQSRVAAAERGNVHPRIETDPLVQRENVRGSASCHQKPRVEPHARTLRLA